MPGVYLHAGAHRTGTTSFQACLALNRKALEAEGFRLAYPFREGFDGAQLRLKMPDPRHDPRQVLEQFDAAKRHLSRIGIGARGLIVSEENLLGKMSGFGRGQFFPMAGARARFVARALPGRVSRILIVLRRYDAFFASAFRLRASTRKVSSFDEMKPGILSMATGWPEVVTALRDSFMDAKITVLDYECRGESRELLTRLVPSLSALAVKEPGRAENASLDQAALTARQVALGADQFGTTSMSVEFSESERALLEGRYSQDLERIARMRGVKLIV